MARESSAEPDRRHRESGAQGKKPGHKKKKAREHSSKRTTTTSEGSGSAQKLSLNALAQLNEYNTRHPAAEPATKPHKTKKKPRPPTEDYIIVEPEYESPRNTPRKEKRRRRETCTDDEREPRRDGRKREAFTDGEADYESREARRERHRSRAVETEDEYVRRDRRRSHDKRKKRIVSGAIVEEGRAPKLRGGAASKDSSYDSIDREKEDAYYESRPSAIKKKRKCMAT